MGIKGSWSRVKDHDAVRKTMERIKRNKAKKEKQKKEGEK